MQVPVEVRLSIIAKSGKQNMHAWLFFTIAIFAATCAYAQPSSEGLQKATDCMLQVLKTTPGVSDPKIYVDKDSTCLEYRPDEKAVWGGGLSGFCITTRTASPPYQFEGSFPGLLGPGEEDADLHVTDVVVKKWREHCEVFTILILT
jgi:hypothetical protein